MSRTLFWIRETAATASWLVIACAGSTALAQETQPSDTGGTPAAQTTEEEYSGHPKDASAGGRERQLPDHAGLFPWGPMSLIVPPVKDLEKWTSEEFRLDLGFRLAFFFQQASGGPGERTTAAQDYRVYGTLHVLNWEEDKKGEAGNIYFRTEYRGVLGTDLTPNQLNTQIGTLYGTAYGQDAHDFALVQLYWEQFLFDGGLRLRVGKIDPDDYYNLGRWADDYRYFSNTLFSAFPAANHPSGGLGFNAQWYISPEWTFSGGFSDVLGKKTEAGFDTIDEGKFIYAADMTYSPTIEGLGRGNYRFGIEYRADVPDQSRPEDTSVYFNIDQEIAKDIAPFLRIGWGTGRSTGIDFVLSGGLGIDNCFNRPGDAFGVGFGFDVAHDPSPQQRDMEYAGEIFYRFQLTHAMQYTVGAQLVLDPVNNLAQDVIGVFEMRLIVDF